MIHYDDEWSQRQLEHAKLVLRHEYDPQSSRFPAEEEAAIHALESNRRSLKNQQQTLSLWIHSMARAVRAIAALFGWLALIPYLAMCIPIGLIMQRVLRPRGWAHRNLLLDRNMMGIAQLILATLGVQVHVAYTDDNIESASPIPTAAYVEQPVRPSVYLYTHQSNLDPPVVSACSLESLKFIGKKIIFQIPIFGWIALAYGNVSINRQNRQQAIAVLDTVAQTSVKHWQRCIAVAPEGTRSVTGLMQPFKKGAFHLAANAGMDLRPVLLLDTGRIWPVGQVFPSSGHTHMVVLPPIERQPHESVDQLLKRTRYNMLKAMVLVNDPKNVNRVKFASHSYSLVYSVVLPAFALTITAFAMCLTYF